MWVGHAPAAGRALERHVRVTSVPIDDVVAVRLLYPRAAAQKRTSSLRIPMPPPYHDWTWEGPARSATSELLPKSGVPARHAMAQSSVLPGGRTVTPSGRTSTSGSGPQPPQLQRSGHKPCCFRERSDVEVTWAPEKTRQSSTPSASLMPGSRSLLAHGQAGVDYRRRYSCGEGLASPAGFNLRPAA